MSATAQSAVTKSVFRKFIDSPAGPKTIHFWAPAMKWVKFQPENTLKDSSSLTTNVCVYCIGFGICWYWRYATSC